MEHLRNVFRFLNLRHEWQLFNFLSSIVLLVGLYLQIYFHGIENGNTQMLTMSMVGTFIVLLGFALSHYYASSMHYLGRTLAYIWAGYFLGAVGICIAGPVPQPTSAQLFGDIMLVASGVLKVLAEVGARLRGHYCSPTRFLLVDEFFLWLGFTCAMSQFTKWAALVTFSTAILLNQIALRQRSYQGALSLLTCLSLAGFRLFPILLPELRLVFCPILIYMLRLYVNACFDCLFSSSRLDERWWTFIRLSRLGQLGVLLCLVALQLTFLILSGMSVPLHQEWYIVMPIFIGASFIWLCFHLGFFMVLRQLFIKFNLCNRTFDTLGEGRAGMSQIMAAKGVRHFALLAWRLVEFTLVSTVIIAGITWETHKPLPLALFLVVLPIEALMGSLFCEMGGKLGGTCIGYTIVSPTVKPGILPPSPTSDMWDSILGNDISQRARSDPNGINLLPPDIAQNLATQCTKTMSTLQAFFTDHMIDNFGCDYSSSGLSLESVIVKLRTFFQQVTYDGPRYDTYLLYYSGQTLSNGDWGLAEGGVLKLASLLEVWQSCLDSSGRTSRLILVLDSPYSYAWVPSVRRHRTSCLAVQTCRFANSQADTGLFTMDWIRWNMSISGDSPLLDAVDAINDDNRVNWRDKDRSIKAIYGVSKSWTDFQFYLPSAQESREHWDNSFPRFMHPMLRLVNCLSFPDTDSFCGSVCRCLRRLKMAHLPPFELDTGHGFRLVRSPNS